MPVIELIVAVCLTGQPEVCSEKHFPFYEDGSSVSACMVRAQPWLAQWASQNPEWTVKTWTCSPPRSTGRDA